MKKRNENGMGVLSGLEPKEVFFYFEEICNIPHPSHRESKLSDYCVDFAQKRGLEVRKDSLGNVVIVKEATPGYETVAPLMLQGHLDMVCEKEPDCAIDFERDGLRLQVEGDYVSAKGTTLGGDDGIAVAYALAVLSSDTLAHPRIETVFTVCEEVGMDGALAIDLSGLRARKLVNLDSEEEGHLLAGCAGGCSAKITLPVSYETRHGRLCEITVDGLRGGHSGTEINRGRANSNLLMGRVLLALEQELDVSVVSIDGGLKDNVIPRETRAVVLVGNRDEEALRRILAETEREIRREYETADPGIRIVMQTREIGEAKGLTKESRRKAAALIALLPNGIQSMSAEIKGLVETSLNLGVLALDGEKLTLRYSVRSSVRTAKEYVVRKLRFLAELLGGSLETDGVYPAWEYRKDSKLREDMIRVYRGMYGREPVVEVIHAGLECGIFADRIPELDAVSIGPDILDIHTAKERLSVSSVKRVWEYLIEVLRQK